MEATAGPSQCTIPVPHQSLKLILTPPRLSDGTAVIASLNDARVHMTLNGPPYPYTEEDWDEWYRIIDGASSAAMEELHAFQGWQETASSHLNSATDIPKRPWVGKGIWISTIRDVVELDEARKEKFIGEISVQRGSFLHVLDEEEREKRKEENDQFEARDPRISREIGFYLVPEYQGRGIMPTALRTLMTEILIPYMNVHTLFGTYFGHNAASKRVFEKCGFTFVTMVPDAITVNEAKIGGVKGRKVGLGVMRWEREPSN